MGEVIRGILIPFLGTTLGASCVLFMKKMMNKMVQRALTGFAAGIMVSASVWSLLIPSMDYAAEMGKFAFVPAVVVLDRYIVFAGNGPYNTAFAYGYR